MSSGDDERLEQLFISGNEALLRRIRLRLGSLEDAEDVAQEGYLRLLARMRRGQATIGDVTAYLAKSTRHLLADRFRRQYRERQMAATDGETLSPAASAVTAGDPEQAVAARQQLERIRSAILRLPPLCRQAFILHRFHGLSYGEIAVRLGVSVSSVEKYIIRALDACRREVGRRGRS